MTKYLIQNSMVSTEEDVYTNGCIPNSGVCYDRKDLDGIYTEEELIKTLTDNGYLEDGERLYIDEIHNKTRLSCSSYTDKDGLPAYQSDFQQWKDGKKRLWLTDFSADIYEVDIKPCTRKLLESSSFACI